MRHFVLGTIWRNNNTVADLQIVKQKKITVMEGRMKATRHNGRSGKHGSYNPKHNDRNFDLNHSEHIDANMAMQNIYWDCYTGKRTATSKGNYESFDAIELRFYEENYGAFVINQNERNARNRHTERNRMIEGIYQNKKTCPEESIYQLGTMDASVKPETLVKVTEDFLEWFEDSYGQFIHILDWALHVDEATPHIHERHVFDAPNSYGEIAPQQDKALELLGFELPYPNKPKSKANNRKMVFDAVCRNKFLELCEEYGLSVDKTAEYGGRKYLEKNDFIIQNQKIKLGNVKEEIDTKEKQLSAVNTDMAAINTMIECMADAAYRESCNLMVGDMAQHMTLLGSRDIRKASLDEEESEEEWYGSSEKRAIKNVTNRICEVLMGAKDRFTRVFQNYFMDPVKKKSNINQIKTSMWDRIEELALTGPKDEELSLEKMQTAEKEEVVGQVQEMSQQLVPRRKGRHR